MLIDKSPNQISTDLKCVIHFLKTHLTSAGECVLKAKSWLDEILVFCETTRIDWWISTELMRALDIINDCIIYELDNESRDLRQEIEFIVELPQTSTTWLDISFSERRVGQHSLVFISSHSSRRREIGFPVMIGKPSALTKKIFLFSSTGSVLLNCLLPFKMICTRFHTSHPGKSVILEFLLPCLVNFVFLFYFSHLYDICLPWNISMPRLPSTLCYNFPAR